MQKTLKQKITAALLALLITAGGGLLTFADEIEEKKDELSGIQSQIQEQKKVIQETQNQADSVTAIISNLGRGIEVAENEIAELSRGIAQKETEIAGKQAEIDRLQAEMEEDRAVLGERLCVIYEEGEANYLEVLLQATSLQDFLTRVDYLSAILDNDQYLIKQTNELKNTVEVEKASLEIIKGELETQKAEEAEKKSALEVQKAEQQTILNGLYADIEKMEQAEAELERESAALETMIRNLEAQARFTSGTGVFMWPSNTSGVITSDYGMRYHPVLHYTKLHTGIDIGAGYGDDVLAADSGTVIFAGWNNAYGKMIIIDHGNSLSTLYAHQSALLVSEGQSVQRGQVIGRVGSTGYATGPHLHFEVRVNGAIVNPHGYL